VSVSLRVIEVSRDWGSMISWEGGASRARELLFPEGEVAGRWNSRVSPEGGISMGEGSTGDKMSKKGRVLEDEAVRGQSSRGSLGEKPSKRKGLSLKEDEAVGRRRPRVSQEGDISKGDRFPEDGAVRRPNSKGSPEDELSKRGCMLLEGDEAAGMWKPKVLPEGEILRGDGLLGGKTSKRGLALEDEAARI